MKCNSPKKRFLLWLKTGFIIVVPFTGWIATTCTWRWQYQLPALSATGSSSSRQSTVFVTCTEGPLGDCMTLMICFHFTPSLFLLCHDDINHQSTPTINVKRMFPSFFLNGQPLLNDFYIETTTIQWRCVIKTIWAEIRNCLIWARCNFSVCVCVCVRACFLLCMRQLNKELLPFVRPTDRPTDRPSERMF